MACCGTSCGYGCGYGGWGGYGGNGSFGGNDGVLADRGCDKSVGITHHGCTLIYPPPRMHDNCDAQVCWREVGDAECCQLCGPGSYSRGSGGYHGAPGLVVTMNQAGCHVRIPPKCLYSNYQCADVTSSCSDSCCGPC